MSVPEDTRQAEEHHDLEQCFKFKAPVRSKVPLCFVDPSVTHLVLKNHFGE